MCYTTLSQTWCDWDSEYWVSLSKFSVHVCPQVSHLYLNSQLLSDQGWGWDFDMPRLGLEPLSQPYKEILESIYSLFVRQAILLYWENCVQLCNDIAYKKEWVNLLWKVLWDRLQDWLLQLYLEIRYTIWLRVLGPIQEQGIELGWKAPPS
jgi:hypothetical protein